MNFSLCKGTPPWCVGVFPKGKQLAAPLDKGNVVCLLNSEQTTWWEFLKKTAIPLYGRNGRAGTVRVPLRASSDLWGPDSASSGMDDISQSKERKHHGKHGKIYG